MSAALSTIDRRRAAAEAARIQRDAALAVYEQACVIYRNRLLECLEHENPGLAFKTEVLK